MSKYRVYVNFSVSQVVDVEADSVDAAMEAAYDDIDEPELLEPVRDGFGSGRAVSYGRGRHGIVACSVNDSRIRIAAALADDARCILAEMDDEMPALPESHYLSQARAHINRGIEFLNKAYTPQGDGDTAA